MRHILMYIIAICSLSGCSAKRCELSLDQSPQVRGFKLGQKYEDLSSRFRSLPTFQADEFGMNHFTLISREIEIDAEQPVPKFLVIKSSLYPDLSDVHHINLDYVDGHLAQFAIFYKNDLKWTNADNFAMQSAQALNLTDFLESLDYTNKYKRCACDGFFVHIGIKDDRPASEIELPYIELMNYRQIWNPDMRKRDKENREKEEQEKRRQQFKP